MFRSFFSQAPELKSAREIGLMREAGKIVAEALRLCRQTAQPGVRTIEIDRAVEALFTKYGAKPLFKGYPGPNPKSPFPASTCISLNEQVVHGIPGQREIRDGDLIKIDTACKLNGWCADAAITIPVGNVRPELRRLVDVGEQVLRIAIDEMGRRRWWSKSPALCSGTPRLPATAWSSNTSATALAASCTKTRKYPTTSRAIPASSKNRFPSGAGPRPGGRTDGQHGQSGHACPWRSMDRRDQGWPGQRTYRAYAGADTAGRRHRNGGRIITYHSQMPRRCGT